MTRYVCPLCGQGGAGESGKEYGCHAPSCDGVMRELIQPVAAGHSDSTDPCTAFHQEILKVFHEWRIREFGPDCYRPELNSMQLNKIIAEARGRLP